MDRRLLDVERSLMTELDRAAVLERVLQTAREVTGARYAALGDTQRAAFGARAVPHLSGGRRDPSGYR